MKNVDVILSLPEELVERAKSKGLLDNARIAKWLEAQLKRIEISKPLKPDEIPAEDDLQKSSTDDFYELFNPQDPSQWSFFNPSHFLEILTGEAFMYVGHCKVAVKIIMQAPSLQPIMGEKIPR